MKCKNCGRSIVDNSIFCNWCGTRQIAEKKKEIKVPTPVKLPSGNYRIVLRAEGASITESTKERCITKARAIRAGYLEKQTKAPCITLRAIMSDYIESVADILSPATIRGYDAILHNRFPSYMDKDMATINWQAALNDEAKHGRAPKTIINSWALVTKSMKAKKITIPDVVLPLVPNNELPWLNYRQIKVFVKAIEGDKCELGALFALHSLRSSELVNISPGKVHNGMIDVQGAIVRGRNGWVEKQANKTKDSRRHVPIMIPRLQTLIDSLDIEKDEKYVSIRPEALRDHINRVCKAHGLPKVGLHGLRRSFASLCHHLGWDELETMAVGGWSDYETVHTIYIKLDNEDIRDGAKKMKRFYEEVDN